MTSPTDKELRSVAAILRALRMTLIYCPGGLWAIEQAGSPGADRWPQSGGESWGNILRFVKRRNARTWEYGE